MATSDEKAPSRSTHNLHTYHCICTHLLLASTKPLNSLPARANSTDHAHILRLPSPDIPPEQLSEYATLIGTVDTAKPVVIRGEMGFEKRYYVTCGRCGVVVGYALDGEQFGDENGPQRGKREDVVYLLPGGMVTTEEMAKGKELGKELELAD